MNEHVAVMVMEDTGEEVLRMRVPAGRQFTYVCPRDGAHRLYIMLEWEPANDEKALDIYGPWIGSRDAIRYYHPPSERAKWGPIE